MVTIWVVVILGLLIAGLCTALVHHRDYEDGIVGRIGLAFIALGCSALVMQIAVKAVERWVQESDKPIYVNPATALLLLGLAVFMLRHCYRFLKRRKCAEGDWRSAARAATCGKQ